MYCGVRIQATFFLVSGMSIRAYLADFELPFCFHHLGVVSVFFQTRHFKAVKYTSHIYVCFDGRGGREAVAAFLHHVLVIMQFSLN